MTAFITFDGENQVDLGRLSKISGFSLGQIVLLDAEIRKVVTPDLAPEVRKIKSLVVVKKKYKAVQKRSRRSAFLIRWLQLCQTQEDFEEIRACIPKSSLLELLFLKAVAVCCKP